MKPKSIMILGKRYDIFYKDLRADHAFGMTDNRKRVILIDQSLTGEELQQTLLHEFFHAVLHRTGASQALHGDLEEVLVDSIATFLVDIYDFHLE